MECNNGFVAINWKIRIAAAGVVVPQTESETKTAYSQNNSNHHKSLNSQDYLQTGVVLQLYPPTVPCAENGWSKIRNLKPNVFGLKCNDFRISTQPYTSKKDQNPRVHQVRLADPPGSLAPPVPAAQGTKARSFNSPSVPQAWL